MHAHGTCILPHPRSQTPLHNTAKVVANTNLVALKTLLLIDFENIAANRLTHFLQRV